MTVFEKKIYAMYVSNLTSIIAILIFRPIVLYTTNYERGKPKTSIFGVRKSITLKC